MYPFIRLAKEMLKFRKAPKLGFGDVHVSHHICWPWDLDLWVELNNGRTLTVYDLGRIPFAARAGLFDVLKKNGWGLTVAGASVRYRRRVRAFARIEMRSRLTTWDARFMYLEQSMWVRGEAVSHLLVRAAVTSPSGIVPSAEVLSKFDAPPAEAPPIPDWIAGWIEAEALRPWPPE